MQGLLKSDVEKNWNTWADRLAELRKDYDSYSKFCQLVLSIVVGRNIWKTTVGKCKISDFVTVSDEAFALLLIDNSWHVWLDMGIKAQAGEAMGGAKGPAGDNGGNRLMTKFTSNGAFVKKNQGWSKQGLSRFVQLVKDVKADREDDAKKMRNPLRLCFYILRWQNWTTRKRKNRTS
jgi:hypothetical protein